MSVDWLYWKWALKQVFFSFWLSVVSVPRLLEIFLKNREKIKTLRRIYPKNQENLRTVILGFNFTGSYKKCTSRVRTKPLQRNQGSTLSFWWPTCFSEWSPFVYRVIDKTKLSITNFQKQIPWNTNESRSLNKTICTYNTSWIFLFYLIIYLFIILFVGFTSITWKCEELWRNSAIMKEISLETWNLNNPQILFQNLLSKISGVDF